MELIIILFLLVALLTVTQRSSVIVAGVIQRRNGDILIIRRSIFSTYSYEWEIPRGHLKKGESKIDCLLREIKEETKLNVIPVSYLGSFCYDDGVIQYNYLCRLTSEDQKVKLSDEHDLFMWIPVKDSATLLEKKVFDIVKKVK